MTSLPILQLRVLITILQLSLARRRLSFLGSRLLPGRLLFLYRLRLRRRTGLLQLSLFCQTSHSRKQKRHIVVLSSCIFLSPLFLSVKSGLDGRL